MAYISLLALARPKVEHAVYAGANIVSKQIWQLGRRTAAIQDSRNAESTGDAKEISARRSR
jgi:hypothetical protein